MPRCVTCFKAHAGSQPSNNQYNAYKRFPPLSEEIKQYGRETKIIDLDDVKQTLLKQKLEAAKTAFETSTSDNCAIVYEGEGDPFNGANPKRYRVITLATSSVNGKSTTAMADTGANGDCMSEETAREFGFDIWYDPEQKASGLDGSQIPVAGTTFATIKVGNVTYTANFQVVARIKGYGIILGSPFLNYINVMEPFMDMMTAQLGGSNVCRGF